ncbi:4Fe-4S dicluster domain-containing protein [Patescibacteria group bacterium]|nr:4Fe-4S dicluster domain-containing protein [Patescibacteria group bacterium]MBU1703173.1 4Fe-4S dicluster domain-containing protein [Patescibacteria group bacterium]MBU1954310.1 4Fe-4S dicluster domain-containing protein [Patescibacteria group bacterium]
MTKKYTIRIRRYDPQTGKNWYDIHNIYAERRMTVLDALNQINEHERAGISYRSSCRMSICGSCGTIVNGKSVLMCNTFLKDLEDPVTIEPLRNFAIVKDLVVDTDAAMEKLRDALPYTTFSITKSRCESVQTPKQLEKIKQTSQCIKCMLCVSACPIYGLDYNFMGPAAAAIAYRYNKDSRDHVGEKRLDSLTGRNGVWKCNFVGECSNVCPKNVDPAGAIQKMKVMGVLHCIKSALKPKLKSKSKSKK